MQFRRVRPFGCVAEEQSARVPQARSMRGRPVHHLIRGPERLQHALAVSALLPPERAALLELLRMLGAADVAMREPAGTDPVARAAGVLVALLDTFHTEVGRLGS